MDYVLNINWLKIPLYFIYIYDSNLTSFKVKLTTTARGILMNNASKSMNDLDTSSMILEQEQIGNQYPYDFNVVRKAKTPIKTTGESPVDVTDLDFWNPTPFILSSELLMLIDSEDEASLKAVYAFFNQNLSDDDLDNLALVECDGIFYYVPFIKNNSSDSFNFIDEKQTPYSSSFPLSTANRYNYIKLATANLRGFRTNLVLNNVWDRLHLLYHASFAETRARIIGRNGDHWDSPNKRFIVPGADQDEFYLQFTTDGKHNILPIGCHFNVDLCFMLNTTNNTATGNHDMFK